MNYQNSGVIQNAQYEVILSQSANDPDGLLDLLTPAGERLITRPIGIVLTESDTGRSVFLAEIKESQAVLVDSHTVMYPDAFDQFNASIVVKSRLSGIESDVILQERLDRALIEQLAMNPATVRIEIWHEVLSKPPSTNEVQTIERQNGSIDQDETIRFSKMRIGPGTAFLADDAEGPQSRKAEVRVAKELARVEFVDVLIESVPFIESEEALSALPAPLEARIFDKERIREAFAAVGPPNDKTVVESRAVSLNKRRAWPIAVAAYSNDKPETSVASMTLSSKQKLADVSTTATSSTQQTPPLDGFVVDFPVTLTSDDVFAFEGDTTYWVVGDVEFTSRVILEGGAVVKFTNSASFYPKITLSDRFECETSPYNPAFFTAEDDDTVGERIASSSGTPVTTNYYGGYNLRFTYSKTNTLSIHDIQSRYSKVAFGFDRPGSSILWNIVVSHCERGLETTSSDLTVRNALINDTIYAFDTVTATNKSIAAEHLTLSSIGELFQTVSSNNCSLFLTNSLLFNITNSLPAGVYSNNVYAVSGSAFTNVGFGFHYLAPGSAYRDVGTTNISPEIKAILAQTTTYAPLNRTEDFETNTVLSPAVQRDGDIPDIGYVTDDGKPHRPVGRRSKATHEPAKRIVPECSSRPRVRSRTNVLRRQLESSLPLQPEVPGQPRGIGLAAQL